LDPLDPAFPLKGKAPIEIGALGISEVLLAPGAISIHRSGLESAYFR
jgi:hypothetical protein